jgi:hypothetical protein
MVDDIFLDESTIPQSNFMKFTKIGDSIQGVLVEVQENVESKFGAQTLYTLETDKNEIVIVGLKPSSHVRTVRQMKSASIGDIVAFKYTADYDSGKGNPGKSIECRIKHMGGANGTT